MGTVFVISDTHFGHANMMKFLNKKGEPVRTFGSVEEMDEHLIDKWNAVVKPKDHVYHLGDVAMQRTSLAQVKRLNGHKRLIPGNHDIYTVQDYLAAGFEKVYGMRVMHGWVMTHMPVHPSQLGDRFKGNVHGHLHDKPSPDGPYVNVSVESVNYTPVPMENLEALLLARQLKA